MVLNNKTTINGLTLQQFRWLMSPMRRETDSHGNLTGRKVSWVKSVLKRIPVFFHRVSHVVFHPSHKWENDKSLFQKLKTGLPKIQRIDADKLPEMQRLAKEVILRNPHQDKACIEEKIKQFQKIEDPVGGNPTPPPDKKAAPEEKSSPNTP